MPKPALKLATHEPPRRSPEREALAQRIQEMAEAQRAVDDVIAAATQADGRWWQCYEAEKTAAGALAKARESEGQRLVDEAMGRPSSTLSIADAEIALRSAGDGLANAKKACDLLEEEKRKAESWLSWKRRQVDEAVRAVVKADPAIATLVAEYAERRRRFEEMLPVMNFLNVMLPAEGKKWNLWVDFTVGLPPESPWRTALDALSRDADAPLPAIGG